MAPTGTQYRQGDVLLVAAAGLPAGLEPLPPPQRDLHPLAPSDAAAGGSHLVPLSPGVRAFRPAGGEGGAAEWLQVAGGGVTITHPEHAPLRLEPGVWRVVRQREYDPSAPGALARRLRAD